MRKLLLVLAVFCCAFQLLAWKTLRIENDPKAKGLDFQLEYPDDWEKTPGKRPNIVVNISKLPAFFNVQVLKTGEDFSSQINPAKWPGEISKEEARPLYPDTDTFIEAKRTLLEGEPALVVEFKRVMERAGLRYCTRFKYLGIFYRDYSLRMTAGTIGRTEEEAEENFRKNSATFEYMFNSLILSSKWKQQPPESSSEQPDIYRDFDKEKVQSFSSLGDNRSRMLMRAQLGIAPAEYLKQIHDSPDYDEYGNYTGPDGVWVREDEMRNALDPDGRIARQIQAPKTVHFTTPPAEERGFFGNQAESFRRGRDDMAPTLLRLYQGIGGETIEGVDIDRFNRAYRRHVEDRETVDPVKGDNWFSDTLHSVANMTPRMVTTLGMNYLAPGSGFLYGAAEGYEQIYGELEDAGYDPEKAHLYALGGGALYGAVEQVQVGKIPGVQKLLKGRMLQPVVQKMAQSGTLAQLGRLAKYTPGNAIERGFQWAAKKAYQAGEGAHRIQLYLTKWAGSAIGEAYEEGLQAVITGATRDIAFRLSEDPEIRAMADASGVGADAINEFAQSLGPMAVLAALGMGGAAMARRNRGPARHGLRNIELENANR